MGVSVRELVALVGGLSNPEASAVALQKACNGNLSSLRWGLKSGKSHVSQASERIWREVGTSVGVTKNDANKLQYAILTYNELG